MGEILFLTHRLPWPPDRGDKIRAHWILKRLATIAPVHLGCFSDEPGDAAHLDAVAAITASVHVEPRRMANWRAGINAVLTGRPVSVASFASARLGRWVRATLTRRLIDRIVIFSGQMAQFVPTDFAGQLVIDFADVDSAKFEQYARDGRGPMAWINAREGRLLAAWEAEVAARADMSLFVSEAEATLFRARSGVNADRVMAVGNGVDTDFYDPAAHALPIPENRAAGPLIVFTGQMDYRPNVEAVAGFARDAMPIIRATRPDAQFVIVGRNPVADVTALGTLPGVTVTGAVADVRSWLAAADVVVAPLRLARGVQNKVLEAMAMARPVVASTAAAEGVSARDGEHLLIAGDAADEARLVLRLLADPARAARIGHAARDMVLRDYSWAAQLDPLARLLGEPCLAQAAE